MTLQGTRGDFMNRWESVFTFHDEGAPWGLVALAQGVAGGPLLAAVDAAIARVSGLSAQPAPTGPSPSTGTGGTAAAPVGTPVAPTPAPSGGGGQVAAGTPPTETPPSGGGGGTGAATGSTPGTATPSTGSGGTVAPAFEPRGPVDLGIPVVDDTLNAVVDALSGLLRAISTP
jgi:hypothetical protein